MAYVCTDLHASQIGNAESAHFTTDIGLERSDLNTAVALFFAFFVGLQPLGAALGRKYGMVAWVPTCMILWGIATALHVWVRHKWQLYTLRILIGCFEGRTDRRASGRYANLLIAGFYPVTVTYLSLFYTRFEFGRRLSLFYGQAAVGGALGGIISYLVFSHFRDENDVPGPSSAWRPWQVLFLLEGSLTIVFAFAGYFWLPHSVETAWFLTPEERQYASFRVLRDRDMQNTSDALHTDEPDEDHEYDEESRGLLDRSKIAAPSQSRATLDDRGVTPHDIFSSIFNTKIWHILICNILSAVPVYAFSVFLPLVLAPLTKRKSPALINLLTAPPHLCGAVILFIVARYSDKQRIRLKPILFGLATMATGLVMVVVLPTAWAIPRYLALNVLLSGTYIASPLTVAWISGNTSSPGKRAILLGINGWGNLAGILAAVMFRPKYAESGYALPFALTLCCIALSAIGFVLFLRRLQTENARRKEVLESWSEETIQLELETGTARIPPQWKWMKGIIGILSGGTKLAWLGQWLEDATQGGREGDEKITFVYGL